MSMTLLPETLWRYHSDVSAELNHVGTFWFVNLNLVRQWSGWTQKPRHVLEAAFLSSVVLGDPGQEGSITGTLFQSLCLAKSSLKCLLTQQGPASRPWGNGRPGTLLCGYFLRSGFFSQFGPVRQTSRTQTPWLSLLPLCQGMEGTCCLGAALSCPPGLCSQSPGRKVRRGPGTHHSLGIHSVAQAGTPVSEELTFGD